MPRWMWWGLAVGPLAACQAGLGPSLGGQGASGNPSVPLLSPSSQRPTASAEPLATEATSLPGGREPGASDHLVGPGGEEAWAGYRPGLEVPGLAEALAGPADQGPAAWPPQLPDRWWLKVAGMSRLADGKFPEYSGVVPFQLRGLRLDDRAGGNGDGVPNPGERLLLQGEAEAFASKAPPELTLAFRWSTPGAVGALARWSPQGSRVVRFEAELGPLDCEGPSCFAFLDHGQVAQAGGDPQAMRLAIRIPVTAVVPSHELRLLGVRLTPLASGGHRLWPRLRNPGGSYSPPARIRWEGPGLSGEAFVPPIDAGNDREGHAGTGRWQAQGQPGEARLRVTYSDGVTQTLSLALPAAP